jgi:DegV family protein with EDD domain
MTSGPHTAQGIAIVTDSTSDIPDELVHKYDIHVVPNIIIMGDKNLEDGIGISRQEFYERLPDMNPLPTTSTASSGVYQELYERLFQQGADQIISIHAPERLSGIFNAASLAAGFFGDRVLVIDSQQITLGLGFQVLAAAESIHQGASMEKVIEVIDGTRHRVRVVAMLDTLEYVHRSGRVSWARARIGALLRIKPFLEVKDGNVFSLGETRTFKKGVSRLRNILSGLGPLERLAVLHTNAEGEALHFLEGLSVQVDNPPIVINVTTIIGTHVGPRGLGFAVVIH